MGQIDIKNMNKDELIELVERINQELKVVVEEVHFTESEKKAIKKLSMESNQSHTIPIKCIIPFDGTVSIDTYCGELDDFYVDSGGDYECEGLIEQPEIQKIINNSKSAASKLTKLIAKLAKQKSVSVNNISNAILKWK